MRIVNMARLAALRHVTRNQPSGTWQLRSPRRICSFNQLDESIKSIVEMKAKPGRRDQLLSTLQQMSAVDAPGFIAAEHYRNVEDEDTVIGIYDWKSNEERVAWSQWVDPGTGTVAGNARNAHAHRSG
jgi:heme-degrading monooxygenase HmoA